MISRGRRSPAVPRTSYSVWSSCRLGPARLWYGDALKEPRRASKDPARTSLFTRTFAFAVALLPLGTSACGDARPLRVCRTPPIERNVRPLIDPVLLELTSELSSAFDAPARCSCVEGLIPALDLRCISPSLTIIRCARNPRAPDPSLFRPTRSSPRGSRR
jgi:hypothetical protein